MKKFTTEYLVKSAMLAAMYVALTLAFEPISYGPVQFRISEVLVLFAFIDPMYVLGLTLGCAIANMFSPLGIIDVAFGTSATFIALLFIVQVRKRFGFNTKALFVASFGPVLANGVIIGIMLNYVYSAPLLVTMFYVAVGEICAVTVLGVLLFKAFISNKRFIEIVKMK